MENRSEQIIRTEFSDIMQKSYIDYAMSVIVSRALPDVRDGLKPVQRRTLYDMYELGIRYDRPYRKCARIVGDTMGKYHPHGDSSIYDALVVMAQEFKKGLPLVDGHGNFGSIEGDGAAAMRYTEARLQKITQEAFLSDLDLDVIDFVPNFDETEKEPEVLPVRIPNLLVNGSDGIAVGMVTSIPPHNLGEVIDGTIAVIENPAISLEQLMQIIPGPDFPTGGQVINQSELLEIYRTGSGKVKLRGKVTVEKGKQGKERIVITEIPYTMIGAGIGKFLNDVAALIESRKTTDIVDISNQSSKDGIRIVFDLKKGADTNNIINMLYKKTKLEDTFGVNMLAVSGGKPEILGLKEILDAHVDFQFELATRKYQNLLKKEKVKREIQEGLMEACDVIDLIIEILRGSKNQKMAKECLIYGKTEGIKFKTKTSERKAAKLSFTEAQATAILEMRLYKLIGLEIEALIREHEKTVANIERYQDILDHYDSMAKVIVDELKQFKEQFARPRKTLILEAMAAVFEEKKKEAVPVVVLADRFGYVKGIDPSVYEKNKEAIDKDYRFIVPSVSDQKILVFTEEGQLYTVKTQDIPAGKLKDKGIPLDNISSYTTAKEQILQILSLEAVIEKKLLFTTAKGMIKLVAGSEFAVSKRAIASTKLGEGDSLIAVSVVPDEVGEESTVVLQTKDYLLRFAFAELSELKKTSIGTAGIKLGEKDAVEAVYLLTGKEERREKIHDKETCLNRLNIGKRNSKGKKQQK